MRTKTYSISGKQIMSTFYTENSHVSNFVYILDWTPVLHMYSMRTTASERKTVDPSDYKYESGGYWDLLKKKAEYFIIVKILEKAIYWYILFAK